MADGVAYSSLQERPSPLLHLWSLAVEEQFHLLWPLWRCGRWPGAAMLVRSRSSPAAWVAPVGGAALAAAFAAFALPEEGDGLYRGGFLAFAVVAAVAVAASTVPGPVT